MYFHSGRPNERCSPSDLVRLAHIESEKELLGSQIEVVLVVVGGGGGDLWSHLMFFFCFFLRERDFRWL